MPITRLLKRMAIEKVSLTGLAGPAKAEWRRGVLGSVGLLTVDSRPVASQLSSVPLIG